MGYTRWKIVENKKDIPVFNEITDKNDKIIECGDRIQYIQRVRPKLKWCSHLKDYYIAQPGYSKPVEVTVIELGQIARLMNNNKITYLQYLLVQYSKKIPFRIYNFKNVINLSKKDEINQKEYIQDIATQMGKALSDIILDISNSNDEAFNFRS